MKTLKVWVGNKIDQEKDIPVNELLNEYRSSDFESDKPKDAAFIDWLCIEKNYSWDTSKNVAGDPVWDEIYKGLYAGS